MIGSNKILIRSLDFEVLQALEAMAKANDRSLEAEGRQALRSYVQPLLISHERSERRAQLSQRLSTALAQMNEVSRKGWRPSHVAQGIGEGQAEPVENWFLGEVEPTFEQLAKVADLLGVKPNWLQHGDGQPFPVGSVRLSEDPGEAVRWLLNLPISRPASLPPSQAEQPFPGMQRLILVRSDSKHGELAIVKQFDDYRCKTFSTPTHVSDQIGAGGEAQLMALSVTLELLYRLFAKRPAISVTSWIVSAKDFSALLAGQIHPLSLNAGAAPQLWWEDFWDDLQPSEIAYWTGWGAITSRIRKAVSGSGRLAKERDLIRSREHPVLKAFLDY